MDPDRWRRIESVYHAALERDPGERSAFLAAACEKDDDLRREVDVLLAQSDSTEGLVGPHVWEVVVKEAERSSGLILLCYKNEALQKGQRESCLSRWRAMAMRSVAIEWGLCRSGRTRRASRPEVARHPRCW